MLATELSVLVIQIPPLIRAGRGFRFDFLGTVQAIRAADIVWLAGVVAVGILGATRHGDGQIVFPCLVAFDLLVAACAVATNGIALSVGRHGETSP